MLNKFDIAKLLKINLLLYAFLIIATPFIMLQKYMQGFISHLSNLKFDLFGLSIPIVLFAFFALLICTLVIIRKKINLRTLLGLLSVFVFIGIGQSISDFYIDYKLYDLQNNWHYFAYFLFAIIAWGHFQYKNTPHNRTILFVWLMAFSISLFDEIFQNFISQRIFDLSDVAKDIWGATAGLVAIQFWNVSPSESIKKPKQQSIMKYFHHEKSTLILISIFSFIFLCVSSLLTDKAYISYLVFITLLLATISYLFIHLLLGKKTKLVLFVTCILLLAQATLISIKKDTNFIFHNNFLSVYNGYLLPFFDVLIFPDRTFRFVDKKTEFNNTDKHVLMKTNPDIILIGAGKNSEGGNGFPFKEKTHFILNPETRQPVQVLIFDSRTACIKYNELCNKRLKVVMVLHKNL